MADDRERRLLGLCATGHVRAEHAALRQAALRALPETSDLLRWAEADGIGPLAALHLAELEGVSLELRRGLLGLAARHVLAHKARSAVLADAIAELRAAGIEHLFLKGAALAQLAYVRPEHRAMRDVDLLLRDRDIPAAERALERAGFTEREVARPGRHEVVTRTRTSGGFAIGLDLHRRLGLIELPSYARATRQTLDELWPGSQPLEIGGQQTRTLGREDLLRSVFRHGFCLQLDDDRLRLVSVADAVTAMESWVDALDWDRLRVIDREVFYGLRLLHHVIPLSDRVLGALGYRPAREPLGVVDQFWGWPRVRRPSEGDALAWAIATLFPSEWWLRIRHGADGSGLSLARSWAEHVAELSCVAARAVAGRPRPER